MNDVLPKPFTRQSLLSMLEKHLVHLKGLPSGIEAPQSVTTASMAQNSATQSVKDESSPGQSPSTSMNNWQSPSQFQGVSPIHTTVPNQFIQQQNTTPTTTFGIDQNGVQYSTTQIPTMNATTGRTQHRRQVSDMSSAADASSFPKRQRMFAQTNPPVVNPMQTSRIP